MAVLRVADGDGSPSSGSPEVAAALAVTAPPRRSRAVTDNYSVAEATVLALAAGADMALVGTTSPVEIIEAIETAVSDSLLRDEQLSTAADRVL